MGKSFVMKRPDGSLAGYLMQGEGEVRFRAHALPEKGGELTIVYSGGAQERHEVSGERETAWPDRGKRAEAAYVAKHGRLLMCTGELGKRAFREAEERAEAERRARAQGAPRTEQPSASSPEKEAKPPDEAQGPEEGARKDARKETAAERLEAPAREKARREEEGPERLPERRWPPPPCMPRAHYEGGRWRE